LVEPQKIENNPESIRHPSFTKLNFSNEQEAQLLQKGDAKKLSSWNFKSVAIGSSILASYGVAVFVIQLFYMSQNL